jgi:putative ABC transport system substrate-binding protein
MKRRLLLRAAVFGAAVPALATPAQPVRLPRIGYLAASANPQRTYFDEELQRLGYGPGRLDVHYRDAEGEFERLPALARELVAMQVDLIVAQVTQAAVAARAATTTIPIVMIGVSDPVASGLVASLGRPGGNVTGTSAMAAGVVGKQLEVLRELVPGLARAAVLSNPANAVFQKQQLDELRGAAARLQLEVQVHEARGQGEFDKVFAAIAVAAPRAVLVLGDPVFTTHAARIAELALRHGLASVGSTRAVAEAGILASYGPSYEDAFRRAAVYVDRILKGAKPASLPVERSQRFELVLNRRTARALRLELPPALVVRADRVLD